MPRTVHHVGDAMRQGCRPQPAAQGSFMMNSPENVFLWGAWRAWCCWWISRTIARFVPRHMICQKHTRINPKRDDVW